MPVEHRPSQTENIMQQAMRYAGVLRKGASSPEASSAKPAEQATATPAKATPAPRPTPNPQVQTKPNQQEGSTMQQNQNQSGFADTRRTQGQAGQFSTMADAGARRIRPISRSAGSVHAKELEEAMAKEMTRSLQSDGVSKYQIQTLDSQQLGMPVPVVLLTQQVTADNVDYLSVFHILIDGADVRLPSRIDKVDGRSIETPTVVGDIYNSNEYIARVEELIRMTRTTNATLKIIDAGGMVLPTNYNIAEQGVHGILYKAALACYNAMNANVQLDETPAYTLIGRNAQQEQLIGRLNFSGESYLDEVGHPVRSDVIVEMDSSRHQAGREFLTSSSNIAKVGAYIEPVYAQPQQDPNNPNNQPFYAQCVITRMQSGYDALDTEMILLDLVTTTMLQQGNGWADAFRPRYNRKGGDIDFRDIGGLGYCGTEGKKVDSQSESFKANFAQFMREYFRLNQGIIFAIDIPEVGPDAFAMDIFRAAGGGNPNAINALVRAADNLTGNRFSPLAAKFGNFPLMVDTGNRIHNGYYVDGSGELRDIRDVDLLAVANVYGKSSPQTIMTWAESFSPNVGPLALRMANRLEIIDDVLNGRQVLTGFSGRYIVGPKFLEVLTQACRDASLVVSPANMVHGLGSGLVMGGYDYGQFAAGQAGAGVFGGAQGAGPASSYSGRGRW